MTKVIEYAKFHTEQDKKEGDKKEEETTFDTEFVKVDQATLFELILVRTAHTIPNPDSDKPRPPLGPSEENPRLLQRRSRNTKN